MKPKLRLLALVDEALSGILQRPGRTALTVVGSVLGVGAIVAVLGLTASASGQISRRFTALAATEVIAEDVAPDKDLAANPGFPPRADQRVAAITGVLRVGVYWTIAPEAIGEVTGVPLVGEPGRTPPVLAASPGYLEAIRPRMRSGRVFDQAHQDRAGRVAVLGRSIASALRIDQLSYQPVVYLGDVPFTVIGVIDQVERQPEVLLDVIIPSSTAEATWPHRPRAGETHRMLIETELGAASIVGSQVSLALRPNQPGTVRVITPPDPQSLKDAVSTDLAGLFLVLASVCLVIGTVGIANTTLVAVLERRHEIGLRRALGARRRHILAQVLAESAVQGGIGGIVGAAVGVATVVAVSLVRDWTPIVATWAVLAAPAVGIATGLLAGLYPSVRASKVEPAEALRR